jgi:hypothetical protein
VLSPVPMPLLFDSLCKLFYFRSFLLHDIKIFGLGIAVPVMCVILSVLSTNTVSGQLCFVFLSLSSVRSPNMLSLSSYITLFDASLKCGTAVITKRFPEACLDVSV